MLKVKDLHAAEQLPPFSRTFVYVCGTVLQDETVGDRYPEASLTDVCFGEEPGDNNT
jgi:hypothetical protein